MDRHIQLFLNKVSYASIAIATLVLLVLVLRTPSTCLDPTGPHIIEPLTTSKQAHQKSFPTSTCDYTHRTFTSLEKKNKRLWSSKTWVHTVESYKALFSTLQAQFRSLLFNHSRALVVSAGPGHAVMALKNMGIADVTGVEVADSPPLVSRADPHNLPFFDNVFDFGFSGYLDRALFPARYVEEIERTVKVGGVCVVAVEECGDEEVREIVKLFRNSQFLDAKNASVAGEQRTTIVMRVKK